MQENSAGEERSQEGANPISPKQKSESIFSDRRFPGAPTGAPMQEEPAGKSRKKGGFQRVVLPTIILLGAIAVIAWVTQYLPSWRSSPTKLPPSKTTPAVYFYNPVAVKPKEKEEPFQLGFQKITTDAQMLRMLWDYQDPKYILEFEKRDHGHYDFFFVNESDRPAELGLNKQNCTCNDVRVSVLPADKAKRYVEEQHERKEWTAPVGTTDQEALEWTKLEKDSDTIINVPPKEGGVLRLSWKGNDVKNQKLNLNVQMWFQPQGKPGERRYIDAAVFGDLVPAVRFYPTRLQFGNLPVGKESVEREFWSWSSTRDDFNLAPAEGKNYPCIQCQVTRLSKSDFATLRDSLSDSVNTRVRCAYKVTVTVAEKKDGKQLDMGILHQEVPIDVILDGEVNRIAPPTVVALVPSDVHVGAKKHSSISLGTFSSQNGIRNQVFPLFTNKDITLEYVRSTPAAISASLSKKQQSGNQTVWELKLSVFGGGLISGPLEKAFVLLRVNRPGEASRQVRIPVEGTAESSKSPF